jgi:hypothetical protein
MTTTDHEGFPDISSYASAPRPMTTINLREFAQGLRDADTWGEAEELTRKVLGKGLKVHELWGTLRCDFRELAEDLCRHAGYEVGPDYATKPAAIDLKALAQRCVTAVDYHQCAGYMNEAFGLNLDWTDFRTYRSLYDTLNTAEQIYLRTVEHIARESGFVVTDHQATKLPAKPVVAPVDLKALAKQCENASTYELFAQLVNERLGTQLDANAIRQAHDKRSADPTTTFDQDYLAAVELIARENGFSVVNGQATKLDATAREALEWPDEEGVDRDTDDQTEPGEGVDDTKEGCDDPECPDHDGEQSPRQTVLDIVDELQRKLDEARGRIAGAESQEKAAKEALEWEQRSSAERGALAEQLSVQVAELTDQRDELINEREGLIAKNQQLIVRQNASVDLRRRLDEALEKLQSETLRSASLERQLDVVKAEREVDQARERLKHAEVQLANRKASLHALRATPDVQHSVKARYDWQKGHWVALEDSVPHADVHARTARSLYPELANLTDEEIRKNHPEKRSKAKAYNLWNQYNTKPAPVGLVGVEVDGDTINFVVDGTSATTMPREKRALTDLPSIDECTIEETKVPRAYDAFRACYNRQDTPDEWRGIGAYGSTPSHAYDELYVRLREISQGKVAL